MEVKAHELVPGSAFPSDHTVIYFFFDSEPEINQGLEVQLLGELGESLARAGRGDLVSQLRGNFLRKQLLRGGNYLLAFRCCQSLVADGISLSSILVDVENHAVSCDNCRPAKTS
jgi:hypothetical protein